MNSKYKTIKYQKEKNSTLEDLVSIEEPLEMIIRYKKNNEWINNSISITMRTPKNDEEDFLKKLGASEVIDRKDLETESRPLDKALWDGVVDTVGGKILAKAISHTRPNGIVAACGLAADYKLHTTVMPFIIRGVKLWGIDSVMIKIGRAHV